MKPKKKLQAEFFNPSLSVVARRSEEKKKNGAEAQN
jgi:hypothetical protein